MCSVSLNIWILKYWKHENSFKYKDVCVCIYHKVEELSEL